VSVDLARRLLAAGVVQRDEAQRALFTHMTRGVPLLRALLESGAVTPRALDDELARTELPELRTVVPVLRLLESLPAGVCKALQAMPVRLDALTGTVDVATVDPFNRHVEQEFAHLLRAPIRLIRAPLAALDDAFRKLEQAEEGPSTRERPTPPPRASRRTPAYLTRPDLDAEVPQRPGVPQLRRPVSEIPIPLVRRSPTEAGRHSALPPAPRLPVFHGLPGAHDGAENEGRQSDGEQRDAEAVPRTTTARPPGATHGPFSSRAPHGPFPDTGPLLDAIRASRSRDEIIDLLLNGLAMVAGRVGAFVVRKGDYHGWRCNEAMADVTTFREVRIPGELPSVLATAAATGFYLGPVPKTAAHATLLKLLGGVAVEIAATPVRVEGKLAMIVLLDDLGDSMLATKRAEELGRLAGEALGRIVQRDKQS
jgi:hypothetical protein